MTASRGGLSVFLNAVVRRPAVIGALVPSSPLLARRLAAVVPGQGEPVVVELGPGTGPVTETISRRLGDRGRHLAIEVDTSLAEHLARRFPRVEVVNADAARLDELLAERDIDRVDAVVGGLPWSLIPLSAQRAILRRSAESLGQHGVFTTFAYLHALPLGGARRFRALLEATFDEVLPTRVVWRNFPPALTYVCRRPRAGR
ncbi:class I SAM-dependent methyltransferase [Actinoalloteichus spitiensis]|uniref:class I SAM-dependent methyltransferase n=1 Tax=Actinoalloteichus spitiensis TaxID=252394 RepID=UPI00058592D5|nr:rRNA adenine N-6-methyltransferase family protein [Actinoalloteichus spitiensis]